MPSQSPPPASGNADAADEAVAFLNTDIQIRAIGPSQRDLLIRMYDQFDPLGVALSLPPHTVEARRAWIGGAAGPQGEYSGILAGRGGRRSLLPGSRQAGLRGAGDLFVHQESRRRGVGTALVKTALEGEGRRACGVCGAWPLPTTGLPCACKRVVVSV